ncbi:hypothetical protein ABTG52_19235, partial [Acinetobacter baumannii]
KGIHLKEDSHPKEDILPMGTPLMGIPMIPMATLLPGIRRQGILLKGGTHPQVILPMVDILQQHILVHLIQAMEWEWEHS